MGKLPSLLFWNVIGVGLLAAIDEHIFPIRKVAAEAWGVTMTTPWVLWILAGVLGLALTVLWEAFSVQRRLVEIINRWRGIPTPQQRLSGLFDEANTMWERGRDMIEPTRAEMDAYAADIATWTANTQQWLLSNFGRGEAAKLTFYADYLGEPSFWYFHSPDKDHNWQITTAAYLARNVEALMKSRAWQR